MEPQNQEQASIFAPLLDRLLDFAHDRPAAAGGKTKTANNYTKIEEKSPVELYKAFADGRDEGLTEIDPDSPDAFSRWYGGERKGFAGGHPWEVCRGGNSTHISLYVVEEKTGGWILRLAGCSIGRVNETIKFAIGLFANNIPFRLSDAREILDMMQGDDYIGIVPEGVVPRYCHSWFPEDRINDFMNLGWEETDRLIKASDWYPVEIKAARWEDMPITGNCAAQK
jgi:hypothetical protein